MHPFFFIGPCNFHGVAECWNDILSKYCENGVCEENPDYCQSVLFFYCNVS